VLGSYDEVASHDANSRRHLGCSIVAPVTIGRRGYVGAGATILASVTIGDDAILGAGSGVRDDVPPGILAVGVPARAVGTVEEWTLRGGILGCIVCAQTFGMLTATSRSRGA
jgi:acetyltransferase-like isoleucine patch superfamily enzyme